MKEHFTPAINSAIRLRFCSFSFALMFFCNLTAQPGLNVYTELGENNVTQGLYNKSAAFANYRLGNSTLETGFQINLEKINQIILSGYTISASRDFSIKNQIYEMQGFCTWTGFSEILREINWGALLKIRCSHFEMAVGTNFKTFYFSKKAFEEYNIDRHATSLHEVFNLMYLFGYNIKPKGNTWNIGFSITDIDYFVINQETNPIFNLHGFYKLNSHLSLNAEAVYKIAGATNLALNYFGITLRTGITWNF